MAGRPQGVQNFVSEGLAPQVIKAAPGILYDITLTYKGASIGDRIVFYDSVDVAGVSVAGVKKVFEYIVPVATDKHSPHLAAVGRQFVKGLVVKLFTGITASDDAVVCVGFD